MARTEVRSKNIFDGAVTRADVNVGTSGSALIRKVVAGTNVSISSTGADAGTGDVTINFNGSGSSYNYSHSYVFSKSSSVTGLMFSSGGPVGNTPTNATAYGGTKGIYINRSATVKTIAISTEASVTASTYQMRVNGVTVKTFTHTGTWTIFASETQVLNPGDVLTFNVNTIGASSGVQQLQVEIEYSQSVVGLQGPQGEKGADGYSGFDFLAGAGVPSNTNGNNGDVYLNNTTGDFYKKILGAWVLQSNLKGPVGSGLLVRLMNLSSTNANNSTTGTQMNTWDTSSNVINLSPSIFTPAADGVTVSQTGTYMLSSMLTMSATSDSMLVSARATVNGVEQGATAISGGMVTSYGISQATAGLTVIVQATAGQKIGVKLFRVGALGTVNMQAGLSNLIIQKVA